jgi:uncharacterized membrane protein HdeD (DUF308 family)
MMELGSSEHGHLTYPWWTFLLRGLAAIAFGFLTLLAPGPSLLVLVLAWGAFALVDGVLLLAHAFGKDVGAAPRWALVLQGLLGVAAGSTTFVLPGLTAIALLYLIAGWCIATGLLEIVQAVRLRKVIRGEWLLGLRGLVSIAVGLALSWWPGAGALAVVLWIGAFAVATGALLIALSIRLRSRPASERLSTQRLAHT